MRHGLRLLALLSFLATSSPVFSQLASSPGPPFIVTITPPRGGGDGKLEIRAPKDRLLEEMRKAIPDSVPLPDQKLGDKLIYRDVQLNKVKAEGLKPSSMTLDGSVFRMSGTPKVTGDLNALYEHIVITTEVRTIAKVFGREVKQSFPVVHRDWRPKGAAPFAITVEVRGTCQVSFVGSGLLNDERLHIDSHADYVRISDVKLTSDEPLYQIVKEAVAVVGGVFPNDGLNRPIKDALTRGFDIDPFKNLAPKDRAGLGRLLVKDVKVTTTDSEVKVEAVLTSR